jgi:hypothetical protein
MPHNPTLRQCDALVERVIVSEGHRAARAAGWDGHMGSRQMHDREYVRCPNPAKAQRNLWPPDNTVFHSWAMVFVPGEVCGVHSRARTPQIEKSAYLERFDPESGKELGRDT